MFAELLRSGQFGSPNFRKRCYILGCRMDVMSHLDFTAMVFYIEHVAPQAFSEDNERNSLMDCCLDSVKFIDALVRYREVTSPN